MRGVLLMCILALCAALSAHYARVSSQARLPENNRSDPLIQMNASFEVDQFEDPDEPIQTASVNVFDE